MSEYVIHVEDAKTLYGNANFPFSLDAYLREEIVRCRDCKYHESMTVSYLDKPLSVCVSEQWVGAEGDNPLVEPDGFCKWGERIEL